MVPNEEGLYYLFVDGGQTLLRAAKYFEFGGDQPLTYDHSIHLYTGAASSLRAGIMCALKGRANKSSVRKTLVCLELAERALSQVASFENARFNRYSLDRWLRANTSFAFVVCDDAKRHKRRVIHNNPSPLNLRDQPHRDYARLLMKWREKYRAQREVF